MRFVASFLLLNLFISSAHAAEWLTIANDRYRRVELDKMSILSSDAGSKVAWGRIVLSDDEAKNVGYKTLRVLNRYECRARSFVVVKRVYLSDDNRTLREETVEDDKPVVVKAGTADERFWLEVCKPPGLNELQKVAAAAQMKAEITTKEPPPESGHGKPDTTHGKKDSKGHAEKDKDKEESASDKKSPPKGAAIEAQGDKMKNLAQQLAAKISAIQHKQKLTPPASSTTPPRPATALEAAAMQHAALHAHWSYEGDTGPKNWANLGPDNTLCAKGQRQSPINIRNGLKVDLEPIVFNYRPSLFRIVDNGHTIQVNYGPGSSITIMGKTYDLVQFHFHRPSEERIDGQAFDMVAHLVHKDFDGNLAIVAVLLQRGEIPQPLIQTLWNNLPLEKNMDYSPKTSININELLPAKREYITYMGSMTTPPCTEGVLWMVMKEPVILSEEQIEIFTRFYKMNARPIQPDNGRIIKESR